MSSLSGEEDLARELIKSMNDEQLAEAVFSRRAYRYIVTGSADAGTEDLAALRASIRDEAAAGAESTATP